MNIFKFAGTDGRYLITIPHRDRWLIIEEGGDYVTEYVYVPGFPEKIRALYTDRGIKYLYGDKRLYLKHCTIKHIPSWAVMGGTI